MAKELQDAKDVIQENKELSVQVHKLQKKVESQAMIASGNLDWKHKGNRLQYEYNLSVVNKLTEASTAAELDDWDEVKQHLKSGIKDLFERNKLIKLGDKSESGWVFAEEYLDNELAENEEYARKIKRAEASAAIKKKCYTDQRSRGRGNSGYNRSHYSDRRSSHDDRNERSGTYGSRSSGSYYDRSSRDNRRSDKAMSCYHCKCPHMRSECEDYKEYLRKQRSAESTCNQGALILSLIG